MRMSRRSNGSFWSSCFSSPSTMAKLFALPETMSAPVRSSSVMTGLSSLRTVVARWPA